MNHNKKDGVWSIEEEGNIDFLFRFEKGEK